MPVLRALSWVPSAIRPLAITALAICAVAQVLAGPPGPGCNSAATGCTMDSNYLVFAEGDSTYEIVAEIDSCESCEPVAGGGFHLYGDAFITFGPYDPGLGTECTEENSRVHLHLNGEIFRQGAGGAGPGGNERTYIPDNGADIFMPGITALQNRKV